LKNLVVMENGVLHGDFGEKRGEKNTLSDWNGEGAHVGGKKLNKGEGNGRSLNIRSLQRTKKVSDGEGSGKR